MLIGTPREVKLETLIITKEGWKYLYQFNRTRKGCQPIPHERLEQTWSRFRYRNGGASSKIHPIAENEIRITVDTFGIRIDSVKELLTKQGLPYREDGFIEECIYL